MKCSFCNAEIPKGTGMLYAKRDGTAFFFCGSKCRRNLLALGRVGKKTPWVKRKKFSFETKAGRAKAAVQKK
ncbi:MAG: hypothetical protein QXH30_00975 [Candidatus Bilamarchaeaceae archaeon]